MKAIKITLFIFAILAGLTVICLVFPTDGIKVGNVTLEFPTLAEVLKVEEPAEKLAEQKAEEEKALKEKMEEIKTAKAQEFKEMTKDLPTRFYMPNNDDTYFDELFAALDDAKNNQVRIIWYGDSQLEEDNMSATLREHLHTDFGGGGVGMVTATAGVSMFTLWRTDPKEGALPNYAPFIPGKSSKQHNKYGPYAQFSHLNGSMNYNFNAASKDKFPNTQYFNKISVLYHGSVSATASAQGSSVQLKQTGTEDTYIKTLTASLPKTDKVSLSISGDADIYGILMDNENGVAVDNVYMRGCSGTIFTSIDKESARPYFKDNNVKLIIMQYGGNAVAYQKSEKSQESFKNTMKKQIEHVKSMAPEAKILFIGPSDMATNIKGSYQSYPQLPGIIKHLTEGANEAGAAYWDLMVAMGGAGSMVEWVKSSPQLAYRDYTHFTPKGACKVTDVLYDTFQMYYKYYKTRMNTKKEAEKQ